MNRPVSIARAVALGGVLLLGAVPLLVARPAPLQDWPNHIARVHILAGLLRGSGFWARFYRFDGFLVPNAALDLGVLGLLRAGLPIAAAAQIFLLVTYLVFVGGFCALARASAAFSPAKVGFVVLLFYSNALFWGLVNYVLGIGLLLAMLAVGLHAGAWRRFCVAGGGAALLLFVHVVPAVALAAILFCLDLHRFATSREALIRRCAASTSWLLALLVVAGLLAVLPGGAGHEFVAGYPGASVGDVLTRKLGLFGKALLGGSRVQDAASLAAVAICIAASVFARARLSAASMVVVIGLIVLAMAAPERLGTGSLLDTRLALLPLLFAAACVRLEPRPLATAIAVGVVLARTLLIALEWQAAGQVFRDFDRRTAALPPGGLMMMAYGTPLPSLSWQRIWSPPIISIATQVVLRDVFMPAIFANPAQQPIALRPEYAALAQPWNLTDAARLHAAASALDAVCAARRFAGVYLTVLYPGRFVASQVGAALLHAQPDFLILDACRLPP